MTETERGDSNMTEQDKQLIEDVKYILNSGDAGIIDTMRVTIAVYLDCIAVKRRHAELTGRKQRLELILAKTKQQKLRNS